MKEIEATVFKNTNQGITMTVNYRSDGTRMMVNKQIRFYDIILTLYLCEENFF